MQPETIIYKGVKYRRYPNSKNRTERVYYSPSRPIREKVGRLHDTIYTDNFGVIPEDFVVHHKDNNPFNNEPSNLEAVPWAKHTSEHFKAKFDDPEYRKRNKEHMHDILPNAH